MREIRLYKCEICGTDYADKSMALACEKFHTKPVSVDPCKYIPYTNTKKPYPETIMVSFENGKKVKYHID